MIYTRQHCVNIGKCIGPINTLYKFNVLNLFIVCMSTSIATLIKLYETNKDNSTKMRNGINKDINFI